MDVTIRCSDRHSVVMRADEYSVKILSVYRLPVEDEIRIHQVETLQGRGIN